MGEATLRPNLATLRPNDTWVQIDLDQWAPLALEGEPYLQRHDLEGKR